MINKIDHENNVCTIMFFRFYDKNYTENKKFDSSLHSMTYFHSCKVDLLITNFERLIRKFQCITEKDNTVTNALIRLEDALAYMLENKMSMQKDIKHYKRVIEAISNTKKLWKTVTLNVNRETFKKDISYLNMLFKFLRHERRTQLYA